MVRLTMLRSTVVNGKVHKVGDTVDVDEKDARYLISKKKAEMHEAMHKARENPKPRARK